MTENQEIANGKLVEKGIEYAMRLACQFHRERPCAGIEKDDYIGAALLGLCDAARKFDPQKGQNFQTYSYIRIRGSMYDLLRRSGGISRSVFHQVINDEPSSDEPGGRYPFTLAKDALELAQLSSVLEEFGVQVWASDRKRADLSYAGNHSPEARCARQSRKRFLDRLIQQLPEREQRVIRRRYYSDQTFEEMSPEFGGASKSWLSRLHCRALDQLRLQIVAEGGLLREELADG